MRETHAFEGFRCAALQIAEASEADTAVRFFDDTCSVGCFRGQQSHALLYANRKFRTPRLSGIGIARKHEHERQVGGDGEPESKSDDPSGGASGHRSFVAPRWYLLACHVPG